MGNNSGRTLEEVKKDHSFDEFIASLLAEAHGEIQVDQLEKRVEQVRKHVDPVMERTANRWTRDENNE